MIRYVDEPACDQYVSSIRFIEDQIKEAIEKTDHDLDSNPEVKKQVAGLVEKMISEYNSYIKFAIEINNGVVQKIRLLD